MVDEGFWPQAWRVHRLIPLFKRDEYFKPGNYRGIHITSILSKVAERLIAGHFGKFAMQLGVRVEQVDEKADYFVEPTGNGIYETDYVEFYPSAFFTYEITEKGQISLNYSRRVDLDKDGDVCIVW